MSRLKVQIILVLNRSYNVYVHLKYDNWFNDGVVNRVSVKVVSCHIHQFEYGTIQILLHHFRFKPRVEHHGL